MAYRLTGAGAVCASLILGACTGAPDLRLNEPIKASAGQPVDTRGKVTRAIDHIACELAQAKAELAKGAPNSPKFEKYAVAAQLTIKLESSGGVTPSLSFINPLAEAGASRTIGVGGDFNRSRLKSFTQNFVFIVDGLKDQGCGKPDDPFLLTGDLGLLEVVQAGLSAIRDDDEAGSVHWADSKKGEISDASQFGSTIQFTTKASANGGLTLTKEKFKGFGGSNGLINGSRVDTDTLVIAFAPIPEVEDSDPVTPAPVPPKSGAKPKNLKGQLYNVPSGLTLEELLERGSGPQAQPVVPPAPPPPPPPSAEEVQKRKDAKDAAARRSAVDSAKRLLDSMILQNIGTAPSN